MAIDTPARIAIIGAGPIGLEATLYARFLGYDVDLFERGAVADNIAQWGHVQLFSPWSMITSPLGRAAIEAQNTDWTCPPSDELPTGREFVERYLRPLAATDLVEDQLHSHTKVLKIGREGLLKSECVGDERRADTIFRLLVRSSDDEKVYNADIVVDASGTFGNHNALGVGGVPAVGEVASQNAIEYGLPDIAGADCTQYASRHTLVIGCGYSAATNIVALAELAREAPETCITWITRGEDHEDPMSLIEDDRLPARDRLAGAANALAANDDGPVTYLCSTSVDRVMRCANTDGFEVNLVGKHCKSIKVDQIIANVGYRPDQSLYSELQVHACYASDGPIKIAAALADQSSDDCLDQTSCGPDVLLNPEPNFYILGAKSYGRNSNFLISAGLRQIRDLFAIIGDRADLDLYQDPAPNLQPQAEP